jgi:hypothetical protein
MTEDAISKLEEIRLAIGWMGHWSRSELDLSRTLHYDLAAKAVEILPLIDAVLEEIQQEREDAEDDDENESEPPPAQMT